MILRTKTRECRVRGVRLYDMKSVIDEVRGNLTVGDFVRELPFHPARYFITFAIPTAQTRGEHAHRECEQVLLCAHGACTVLVDDGREREEFRLDHPARALYVPPMVWAAEYRHTADSALLVFASHDYNPADYIRDYGEFRRALPAS